MLLGSTRCTRSLHKIALKYRTFFHIIVRGMFETQLVLGQLAKFLKHQLAQTFHLVDIFVTDNGFLNNFLSVR